MRRTKKEMKMDKELDRIKEEKIHFNNDDMYLFIPFLLNDMFNLIKPKNPKSDLNKDYLKLRNRIAHSIPDINKYINSNNISTFDLKSSIKLSYGTKKLLDKLNKFNSSYEELILGLIQENNRLKAENDIFLTSLEKSKNLINIDINKYQRTSKIFEFLDMKIKYSCNKFSPVDDSYQFNIKLEKITRDGKEISLDEFFKIIYMLFNESDKIDLKKGEIIGECIIYFTVLYNLLKENFKIKGNITNSLVSKLGYWEYKLNKLNLTHNIKEKDISEKIESFKLQLMKGTIKFDYSNNDGMYQIGKGLYSFTIKVSSCGDNSLYLYRDPSNMKGVGLIKNRTNDVSLSSISKNRLASVDMSSRTRIIDLQNIGVLLNKNEKYALLRLKKANRNDPFYAEIEYSILKASNKV